MKGFNFSFRKGSLVPAVAVVISAVIFANGILQPARMSNAYSFPNVFVALMLLFAVIWLVVEVFYSVEPTIEGITWPPIFWGLVIMIAYLVATVWLGFLVASILLLFVVGVAYSPIPRSTKNTVISALVAIGFLAVIYALFNEMLKVQTPGGVFGLM